MPGVQPQLVPVNIPAEALSAQVAVSAGSDGDGAAPPALPSIPNPQDLSTWQQEIYEIAPSLAASVGFPLWSVEADEKLRVMLFGTSRYLDVPAGNYTYRYGIAIRVMLEIFDSENKAKLSLPAIAAQVELDVIQANAQLIIAGYTGNIASQLPSWEAFDVNSYTSYMAAVSTLQKTIFGDMENTKPALLGSTLASKLKETDSDVKTGSWLSHLHL